MDSLAGQPDRSRTQSASVLSQVHGFEDGSVEGPAASGAAGSYDRFDGASDPDTFAQQVISVTQGFCFQSVQGFDQIFRGASLAGFSFDPLGLADTQIHALVTQEIDGLCDEKDRHNEGGVFLEKNPHSLVLFSYNPGSVPVLGNLGFDLPLFPIWEEDPLSEAEISRWERG